MVVCDLHTDSVGRMKEGLDLSKKTNGPVDLLKLQKGKILLIVFACWVPPRSHEPFSMAARLIELIWKFAEANDSSINIIRSWKDVATSRVNIIIGVEGGHIFDRDILLVDALFRAGVRIFTMTWDNSNSLAHSAVDNDRLGLTRKGRRFVERIIDLGGIVDLSHASTKTVVDCSNLISTPVIASHSCIRTLNPIMRNISDQAIDAIASVGGVIGINVSRRHLGKSRIVDQVQYMIERVGASILAFGSDFDGIKDPIIPDCSRVIKMFKDLTKFGIDSGTIEAMASENFLRVLEKCVP